MARAKQVPVGIIGAGRIGRVHAEHLAFRIPQARLVAIADVSRDAAEACATANQVDAVHQDYRAILADDAVVAVVICSSTKSHAAIIAEAAAAGKHIFCEKPIDIDLANVDKALEAVRTAGVKLQVGFNRRFDPNFTRIHQAVSCGEIGEPHLLHIISRDPAPPPMNYLSDSGGLFLDMTIHDFDMARYLIGSEVKTVFAVGAVRIDPRIGQAGDIDTAVITLEFDRGVLGTIENSRQAVYGYDQRVEVFGSEGMIHSENMTSQRTILSNGKGVHSASALNFFVERYAESYLAEMRAFLTCIQEDTDPPVTGADARAPLMMGLAALRSMQQHRPVPLAEIDQSESDI